MLAKAMQPAHAAVYFMPDISVLGEKIRLTSTLPCALVFSRKDAVPSSPRPRFFLNEQSMFLIFSMDVK